MRFAMFGVLVLACGCGSTTQQPAAECPPCPECAAAPQVAETTEVVEEDLMLEDEAEPSVSAGACDTSALPPGLAVDLSDDEANALLEEMRTWVEGEGIPGLDYGNGTLFAKSEDDTGMDPPHPSWIGRNAERACGMHQVWLRARAMDMLALHASPDMGSEVRCSDNVCCYDAPMEYSSSGTYVFARTDEGRWVLRAMVEVADNGTLGAEWIAEERAWVTSALRRHARGRCSGEPSVAW
jgi:hypothetical protein